MSCLAATPPTRCVDVFSKHSPTHLTTIFALFADNVWWSTGEHTPHSWRHHPHPDAPRCIPCHYDDSAHVAAADATIPSFKAIKGCPCTPELLCAHNNHSDHMSEDWFNKYCDMPRLPYHMYSMHGGAGALMSIGLMRRVSWDFVEPCVLKTYSTGTSTTVFASSVVYVTTVFCVVAAVLCSVLCCAVLCCAVLCCAVLYMPDGAWLCVKQTLTSLRTQACRNA